MRYNNGSKRVASALRGRAPSLRAGEDVKGLIIENGLKEMEDCK
jgi:hypothetical protein